MSVLRPLILLSIILTASGIASEQLGPIVGPVEYNGYLVFDYPEGDNPIVNIVFDVDPWVSECLLIVNVPAPWTYTYSDSILTLSGGSLNPGGSVSVTVSLDEYFEEGEYQVTSVGTTSAGEVSNAAGLLLVGNLYLLRVISLANTYQTPLLGSVIGLIALELMFWYRNRPFRDIIPPVKEVNDFVRESETVLNQNGKPKDPIVDDSKSDIKHESVIPELAPYDGTAPIDHSEKESPEIDNITQHSMYPPGEDPSELFRYLNEHSEKGPDEAKKGETFFGGSLTGNDDIKYEFTPEQVDNILNSGKAKSPEKIAEAIGDSLLPDSGTINSDPANSEIKKPKTQTKTDTEYDDSDLPGLEGIPEPDSSGYDDSDLPALDDQPSTTKSKTSYNGGDKATKTQEKKPRLKRDEVIDG